MVVPSAGGRSAPGEMAMILPPSIVMLRSATAAAPVPSMSSTCSRITFEVFTLTYLRTCGESASPRCAHAMCEDNIARQQMTSHLRNRMVREKHVDISEYLAVHFSIQNSTPYAQWFPGRRQPAAR